LTFKKGCFAASELPFRFFALGDISIDEVNSRFTGAKRERRNHDRNVQSTAVFAPPHRLQIESLSRPNQSHVFERILLQFLRNDHFIK
jgi:hypothetical protein